MSEPFVTVKHGLAVPLRPGVDTPPAAVLEIHSETVQPEWIDYNGHMNVAYYVLAFDHATDRFFDLVDLGLGYVNRTNGSVFVLETHVGYRQEVKLGDPLRFTLRLVDVDDKRLHYYFEMFHAEEGYLAATSEQAAVHVDLETRRSAPFPPEARARLQMILEAQAGLELPTAVGRSISLKKGR